jgi:ferredoxin
MKITVAVDPAKCVISGRCAELAPDKFTLAERGPSYPSRSEFAPEELDTLREAEDECPSGAITVLVEDTP